MKLSECMPEHTEIFREGNFSSMGTLFSRNSGQVVYITREADIQKVGANPEISCVITTAPLAPSLPDRLGIAVVQDPKDAFYTLQGELNRLPEFVLPAFIRRISVSAKIHPSVTLAPESVMIGRDVIIEKNVVIHQQTIVDDGSIIRSNSIIGEVPPFLPVSGKRVLPCGGVHLHRDTDVHANIVISRALFRGYTDIGEQTKIDNLGTIGQGTVIGTRCLLCGGVLLGDSVKIGDDVWIGPNVDLADQIALGNRVYVTIGSHVTRDVADEKVVKDNHALDRKRFSRVIRGM